MRRLQVKALVEWIDVIGSTWMANSTLAMSPVAKPCQPYAVDAAMLSSAQAVEHHEITRYGTLIALARQLGRTGCIGPLGRNLEEEKAADKKLTTIAEGQVNRKAAA